MQTAPVRSAWKLHYFLGSSRSTPHRHTSMINLTKVIAAILVIAAALLGGYALLLSRKPPPPAPVQAAVRNQVALFPVVVMRKAAPAGLAIPADALRVEQLPINPTGAFRDIATAAGRVPVFDLGEGTPLLENQMASGLALRVAEGERAVAVKADEIMGVGNKLRPGDFVDVFFVLKTDGKEIDRSQVRLLLARKRVLAFGNASVDGSPSMTAEGQNGKAQQPSQRAEAARTAVLAVPVEEVGRLALGEASGRLLLALRHPTDMSLPDVSLFPELPTSLQPFPPKAGESRRGPLQGLDRAQAGLTVADLASGGDKRAQAIAAAVTARPARAGSLTSAIPRSKAGTEVEVIRGDKRETQTY